MNENIDLTKILKDCPKGWEFYSVVYGKVEFLGISKIRTVPDIAIPIDDEMEEVIRDSEYPVKLKVNICEYRVSKAGEHQKGVGECTLFPSKDQRDWSKFTAPWYKKEKFDPKTLKPFDRVICKGGVEIWRCNFFSSYNEEARSCPNVCVSGSYARCIPYNEETKHLVGTTDEAPEYYRYWKDDCKHNTENPF